MENTRYYDIREGRYRYIDYFPMYNSLGYLAPEIGFEGTGFPSITRSILRRVYQLELEEEE